MNKIIIAILLTLSFCFAAAYQIPETAAQNLDQDFLQQYLQSKQEQQQAQQKTQQEQQQTQQQTQENSGLNHWEIMILIVYIITILLAWITLVLGIITLTRSIRQKNPRPAVIEKRLM